jgi:hypothetical protein
VKDDKIAKQTRKKEANLGGDSTFLSDEELEAVASLVAESSRESDEMM